MARLIPSIQPTKDCKYLMLYFLVNMLYFPLQIPPAVPWYLLVRRLQ